MPLIVFECKGTLPRAARGLKGLSKPEAGTLLLWAARPGLPRIHFVVECEWSSPAHRASSGLCLFALDEDPAVISQRVRETVDEWQFRRLSDSMTDKMRGAV
jgi:hypothetical protein